VLGLSKDEARDRAAEFLDKVGLADKVDEYPARLSGGQKQRVAIARALAMEPEVMCFDEVTSALDPELVGEVLNVLRDLAHTRMTMLIVTHEIGFARDIGDRLVMFDEGRIIEEAPPEELLSEPKEPRTQEFLRAVIERA
ncbi:MAG: amino acid ABC transporter ATP-binding protein, partial [Dehalococcoidia bacterium]